MVYALSLGSGSSGNATLIDDGTTVVLVDCGVSHAALISGLAAIDRTLTDLSAVLVTHEHADHIRSLDRLVRRAMPVLCTSGTASAAGLSATSFQPIELKHTRSLRSLSVTAIPVCHDAAEPCGYLIQANNASIAVITDAGCATEDLAGAIGCADLIILESNHDERMLRRGPYPAPLKRRVLSDVGHLSNRACAGLLAGLALIPDKRPSVWLAHLSAVNNRPELAVSTVLRPLTAAGRAWHVEALPRLRQSRIWHSDQEHPPTSFTGQLPLPGL